MRYFFWALVVLTVPTATWGQDEDAPEFSGATDSDRDGISSVADKCPHKAEDKDGFEDEDGCPDHDNDNDGILDDADNCPNQHGEGAADGCPVMDGPTELATDPRTVQSWDLTGAKLRGEGASWQKPWALKVREAAEALLGAGERSCLKVGGLEDATGWKRTDAEVRNAGGRKALGSSRANGRRDRVKAELEDAGVDPQRLKDGRSVVAGITDVGKKGKKKGKKGSKYRGARIELVENCLPPPPPAPEAQPVLAGETIWAEPKIHLSDKGTMFYVVLKKDFVAVIGGDKKLSEAKESQLQELRDKALRSYFVPHGRDGKDGKQGPPGIRPRLSLGLGGVITGAGSDSPAAYGVIPRLALTLLGIGDMYLQARVAGEFVDEELDRKEQTHSIVMGATYGWNLLDGDLLLGLGVDYSQGGSNAFDAWRYRAVTFGADVSYCVSTDNWLCFTGQFQPLGMRWGRLIVTPDENQPTGLSIDESREDVRFHTRWVLMLEAAWSL